MTNRHFSLRRVATVLVMLALALSVTGCGRTLVFVERDGVNFAVRANPSATPPLGVNFGLERVVATIVPPAGQTKDANPDGEAINMFAGFQIDATDIDLKKALDVGLKVDTQFASGQAAKNVANNSALVAEIVTIGPVFTYGVDANTALLHAFVYKPGTTTVDPERAPQMRAAMKSAGVESVSITTFMAAKEYAAARSAVVKTLKLK